MMLLYDYKYYLETNALYQLNRYPESIAKSAFTSAFAILELLTGINEKNFKKRQSLARSIKKKAITIDWRFPEELFFDGFDCTSELYFEDSRSKGIQTLYEMFIRCENHEEFLIIENDGFDLEFFKLYDENWNQTFVQAVDRGNKEIKDIIKKGDQEVIEYDGIEYSISTKKEIQEFMIKNPSFNISITILALSNILMDMCKFEFLTIEDVFESYNDFIKHFVWGQSLYSALKIINSDAAKRNDIQDLIHLLYLRDCKETHIVSDDRFYQFIAFPRVKKCDELIENLQA